MDLCINEFGSFLGKKSRRFIVKHGENETEVPVEDVDTIFITTGGYVSTDAIKLASESFVDVVILDLVGNPISRVFPCMLGGTTLTRKQQAEAAIGKTGVEIANAMVVAKILNQGYFLNSLAKTRENSSVLKGTAERLIARAKSIKANGGTIQDTRQTLLGCEGISATEYFSALSTIIPFKRRERPATDPINALLNYGYGFLYSEGERACISAGLDPYLGFFHADRYGKPCMVLDIVEPFRPVIVDRAVVTAWVQKSIQALDFEPYEGGGLILNQAGRKKFCEIMLERLNAEFTLNGKKIKFKETMLWQARQIVSAINGKTDWETFIYRW